MSEEQTAPETGAEPTIVDANPVTEAPETAAQPQAGEAAAPEAQAGEEGVAANAGKARLSMRFSELTAQRDAEKARAEREAQEKDYWRDQALARQALTEPVTPEPGADEPTSLTPAQLDALVERKLKEREQTAAQAAEQKTQADKATALRAKLYESGLEGAALIASGADIPFSQAMLDALTVSDQAAQIAHHLGTNPAEAARISVLPPQLQGYELAKLESRLASLPRTTKAPEPPSIVGARGQPATGLRDDLPIADWMRIERELAAKRR